MWQHGSGRWMDRVGWLDRKWWWFAALPPGTRVRESGWHFICNYMWNEGQSKKTVRFHAQKLGKLGRPSFCSHVRLQFHGGQKLLHRWTLLLQIRFPEPRSNVETPKEVSQSSRWSLGGELDSHLTAPAGITTQ